MDTRIVAIETYVGLQKNNFGVAVEPYLDEIEMGIQVAKKVVAKLPSNNEPISTVIFASAPCVRIVVTP
ncbi:hypothetical protein [Shewanella sp.]|uniref:hypothetical protein n=1 Tax=Shewanella sp. TaxID=50422 RepID=UPI001EB267DF|nr:hypothetical protein [Shewanella sp.]NRB25728.1 hypothetical protein [Shewanella sp.]